MAPTQFDLVFPCHPDKMGDIYVPRMTQEIQTDSQRRSRRGHLLWRSALQFNSYVKCWHKLSVICNIIWMWYARPAHTYTFSITNQLSRKHTSSQSVAGQGHAPPKTNKLLFKSCNSIKLIFIISAHGSAARKYLSFICLWITMRYTVICIHRLYVLGKFLWACVCCDRIIHLCALKRWQGQKANLIQGTETAPCLWATRLWNFCMCCL